MEIQNIQKIYLSLKKDKKTENLHKHNRNSFKNCKSEQGMKILVQFDSKRKTSPKIRFLAPPRKTNLLNATENLCLEPPALPIYPIQNLRKFYEPIIQNNTTISNQHHSTPVSLSTVQSGKLQ